MKKYMYASMILIMLLLSGCSQNVVSQKEEQNKQDAVETTEQLVMVNQVLYRNTNKESTILPSCGTMDGKITSIIEKGKVPKENGEANFGDMYGYQFGYDKNELIVFMDNKLMIFEKWDESK